MNKLKKSILNLGFSLMAQIITIVLAFLLPRVILVNYGSEINGLLNSVTQLIAYLAIFEAGIQSAATKSLYETVGHNDYQGSNQILAAVNLQYRKIGCLYFLGLLLLSIVYSIFVSVEGLQAGSVCLIIFFSGLGNVISFFFQSKYKILLTVDGKEYVLTFLNTVTNIINSIIKILLLSFGVQVHFVIIVSFFVFLLQTFLVLVYIKKNYRWIDLQEVSDYTVVKQSHYAMVHQISGLIFSNIDVLLLTIFCDLKIVSVYTVYKMIMSHISNILGLPFMSCTFALGQEFFLDRERYKKLLDSIQIIFAIMIFSIFSVTYVLLLPFISLYTADITDVVYVDAYLPILFITAEILNLIRYPSRHTVNCAGHFKETMSRSIIETVLNLTFSIIGVYFIGIYGVLLGTIVALGYRSIDFIFYADHKILKRSAWKDFLLYGMNFLLFIAVAICMEQRNYEIGSYFDFIAVGLRITSVAMIVFMSVNMLLYKKEMRYMFDFVKHRLK